MSCTRCAAALHACHALCSASGRADTRRMKGASGHGPLHAWCCVPWDPAVGCQLVRLFAKVGLGGSTSRWPGCHQGQARVSMAPASSLLHVRTVTGHEAARGGGVVQALCGCHECRCVSTIRGVPAMICACVVRHAAWIDLCGLGISVRDSTPGRREAGLCQLGELPHCPLACS